MNELTVTTDAKRRLKSDLLVIGILFLVITALCAFVILKNSGLKSFFITELLAAAALGWTAYRSAKSGNITLHFKGDTLCISYADGRRYNISDVERSYFRLKQSEKEAKDDIGSLYIDSTNFKALHIQQFSKVNEYVATHFNGEKKSIYYFDEDDSEE